MFFNIVRVFTTYLLPFMNNFLKKLLGNYLLKYCEVHFILPRLLLVLLLYYYYYLYILMVNYYGGQQKKINPLTKGMTKVEKANYNNNLIFYEKAIHHHVVIIIFF